VKAADISSTPVPADTASDEFQVWRGKRFFNTSTGIWAKEGWGSCQGCHPLGLTDNVTWQFAAGPRQTIALDGQYASNDPSDMRALNWTAIFDETADFELNTRGVSGGTGAIRNAQGPIVSAAPAATFAAVLAEDGTTTENHQGLNGSLTFIIRNAAICSNANTCPDWDQIDAYIRTIRSPNRKTADAASIAQGRVLFQDGGCDKCHGGAKWTVSRTFYAPETFTGQLPARTFEANRVFTTSMDPSSLSGLPQDVNVDATLIAGDDSEMGTPPLKRMACNIRNVGTFAAAGGADELRANATPAQGRSGFNPPSLLGLAVGAPYLHNGAAETLDELLDPSGPFAQHLRAGNPNFVPTAQDRAALLAFLLSIDEAATPFGIAAGSLLCP
jgi:mono/diheme cytochrome c family protein